MKLPKERGFARLLVYFQSFVCSPNGNICALKGQAIFHAFTEEMINFSLE